MSKIIKFKELEFKTDKDKAIPVLEHDFYPYEDDKEIVVRCKYFTSGEQMNYVSSKSDGTTSIDMRAIVRDKVISISGIKIVGKNNKEYEVDKDMLLNAPANAELTALISLIAVHIISGDNLNDEEVKN